MSASASNPDSDGIDPTSPEYFDRFDNGDAAQAYVDELEQKKRERHQEIVKVYGAAAELFQQRLLDTVTIERHNVEIEFYRPVDATDADLSSIAEERPELADRLKRGSRYLDEFERAQREALEALGKADDFTAADLEELHNGAEAGTEIMRKALSCFAVDESFHDPRIWTTIFQSEDTIKELFEHFFSEGDLERLQERRAVLQSILSGADSTS